MFCFIVFKNVLHILSTYFVLLFFFYYSYVRRLVNTLRDNSLNAFNISVHSINFTMLKNLKYCIE